MKKVFAVLTALTLLGLGTVAQANVFDLGIGFANLETVAVGDQGNGADTRYEARGYGWVGYTYNIGKYEVTAKQYTDFLNAKAKTDTYGLWTTDIASYGCRIQRSGASGSYSYSVPNDWANRPVNYMSYWDACRFANWLNNGQGSGDSETGAYTLNGYNENDGRTAARNRGAKWFVPNEDEWYKAAYYKGGTRDAGYWDYPAQSNSVNTGMANYGASVGHTTNVGSYPYPGAYGTFDQGGNVWEMIEPRDDDMRCISRGGSYVASDPAWNMHAACTGGNPAVNDDFDHGFRVAYIPEGWQPVPEPSSLIVLGGGLVSLVACRRRKV